MKNKIIFRINTLKFLLTFLCALIIWKLFCIQVIKGKEYQKIASTQYKKEKPIPAKRGYIYDRNMRILAQDLKFYSFGCYLDKIKNRNKIAATFARYLGENKNKYLKKMRGKKGFVFLDRKVEKKIGDEIWEHGLEGVSRKLYYSRYYPASNTTAQITGFTDVDNRGLTGLEKQYEEILRGKNGSTIYSADAIGRTFPDPTSIFKAPKNGSSVVLTIDLICQTIAEEELKKAVEKSKAAGGMIAIMNPKTGEMLAMASCPDFNPNEPQKSKTYNYKNRFICDTFEPGSTFKLIAASAVLEENIKKPADVIFCENGSINLFNHKIRDSKPHGNLTFQQVIEKSSNIGVIKCSMLIGKRKLYSYARDFGFGNETGMGLIGEVRGTLKKPSNWSKLSLPMISFGHEITTTGIQLINAYAAVANKGILIKPQIIKEILNTEGDIISKTHTEEIRRVVSEKTANTLKSFFVGAVEHGTGINAKVEGITIGGKTGTAQKVLSNGKGYSNSNYTASFVGFWPAENPEFVCLVVIESPRNGHYGGTVAAPALKNIVKRITNIPSRKSKIVWKPEDDPSDKGETLRVRIPDVRNLTLKSAKRKLERFDQFVEISGNGSIVTQQNPKPGSYLDSGKTITLVCTNAASEENKYITAPRVVGMSMRKAINTIQQKQMKFKVTYGSGVVVEQSPKPGNKVRRGSVCYIRCARYDPYAASFVYK